MKPHPDRLNRTLLFLLGLLLMAAGLYGLLRGWGAFGRRQENEHVLPNPVSNWVGRHDSWFWIAAAAASIVVALLGLWWLISQVRSRHAGALDFDTPSERGSTHLQAGAAERALSDDIETYVGVDGVNSRLLSSGKTPEVRVRVDLTDDADVASVRRRIEEHAFPRFCQAIEADEVAGRVRLRVGAQTVGRRVE